MGLFNKHKEPIFLKEKQCGETQLERLNKLKPLLNSERLAIIERILNILNMELQREKY